MNNIKGYNDFINEWHYYNRPDSTERRSYTVEHSGGIIDYIKDCNR